VKQRIAGAEIGRHGVQKRKGNSRIARKRELVIDPALEKPLLRLHRAMDANSFWKAVHRLLSASIVNRAFGLSFQQNPGLPVIAKCTRSMPDDFFAVESMKRYALQAPRKKLMYLSDLYGNRSSFVRSGFYRRYMAPQKCAHGIALCFWKRQRLICVIAILRTPKQGDFLRAEIELLRQLYPQFVAALRRIESLERERSVRENFEEFLRRLPLPTMILRWNLKPIYENPAAREFCAVWEKGPEEAKRMKATSPIPAEILDRCHVLKQQWMEAQLRTRSEQRTDFSEEQVHHPGLPHLRATIHLRQIKSAGVAQPHFLIACEDLCRNGAHPGRLGLFHLPSLARLTIREQEVARLVCSGQSNKEIADTAHLSVAMVKKHLHAVFRKLEVPSRSRLLALML
jgi:DNA-binding CsgD family transcriptional regulator